MEMQRRQFIQGAAALGAGALVASLTGCATGPSTSMSDTGTDTATSGARKFLKALLPKTSRNLPLSSSLSPISSKSTLTISWS